MDVACSLRASLEDCPLFLLDRRPLRLDLGFKSMSFSSTSWLVSTYAITKPRVGATEVRSMSESESKSSTGLADTFPSLAKQNWSI